MSPLRCVLDALSGVRCRRTLQVGALLEDGHDLTARDSRGRTPYAVANSKAVRDAFRRSASLQHKRQWIAWQAGASHPTKTSRMQRASAVAVLQVLNALALGSG